jgi:hypothetical protein
MENYPLLPVDVGVHVDIELIYEDGETEGLTVDIVLDKSADYAHGFLGAGTPLARTLIGNTAGSRLIYQAGDIRFVRILAVHPGLRAAAEDHSARRQETYDNAVEQSHRTNIILAASSMDSKWGAYDIGPIEDEKKA